MRRALLTALLASLTFTGTAAAAAPGPPMVSGSVVGPKPIVVAASITPPVQTFGNAVTATVSVLADRKWIDPADLRVVTHFFPYAPVGPALKHTSVHGRYVQVAWSWTLRCLTVSCVPLTPPSDLFHVFHLRPAFVNVVGPGGKVAYSAGAHFPATEILSEISPAIAARVRKYGRIPWQYDLATPAPSYRVSPDVVFWVALVLSVLCGAAGVALVARWFLRLRTPTTVAVAGPPSSSLERALALFFWAGGRGDETLQRKALERVAAELPFDVADLSDATREIAWSPDTPGEDEVEALSERAGVPAHPRKATDE